MRLESLMRICRAYNNLGWAVQEQLDSVLADNASKCNPNALAMIEKEFVREVKRAADDSRDERLLEEIEEVIEVLKEERNGK